MISKNICRSNSAATYIQQVPVNTQSNAYSGTFSKLNNHFHKKDVYYQNTS